jgi:hypothetical protein
MNSVSELIQQATAVASAALTFPIAFSQCRKIPD